MSKWLEALGFQVVFDLHADQKVVDAIFGVDGFGRAIDSVNELLGFIVSRHVTFNAEMSVEVVSD